MSKNWAIRVDDNNPADPDRDGVIYGPFTDHAEAWHRAQHLGQVLRTRGYQVAIDVVQIWPLATSLDEHWPGPRCGYATACDQMATTTIDAGPLGTIWVCHTCADRYARFSATGSA